MLPVVVKTNENEYWTGQYTISKNLSLEKISYTCPKNSLNLRKIFQSFDLVR